MPEHLLTEPYRTAEYLLSCIVCTFRERGKFMIYTNIYMETDDTICFADVKRVEAEAAVRA